MSSKASVLPYSSLDLSLSLSLSLCSSRKKEDKACFFKKKILLHSPELVTGLRVIQTAATQAAPGPKIQPNETARDKLTPNLAMRKRAGIVKNVH